MSEERFIDIESKLAHQEQLLGELNEVLIEQQARIMQLEQVNTSLIERVRAIGESTPGEGAQDERPPHY
jgi:SlyX protein